MKRKIFPLKLSDTESAALATQAAAAGLDRTNYIRLLIEKDGQKPSGKRVGGLLEKAKPLIAPEDEVAAAATGFDFGPG